jgi:hypothetical protein
MVTSKGGLAAELAGVKRVQGRQIELRDESDQEEDEVVLGECVPRRDRVVTVLPCVPGTVILASAVHDAAPGSHARGSRRSETRIVPAVNGAVQIPRSRAPREWSFSDRLPGRLPGRPRQAARQSFGRLPHRGWVLESGGEIACLTAITRL